MPILTSFTPDSMMLIALSRSASMADAGITMIHLSFQALRPTRRVDLKSFPARRVEWRRIFAVESLVPSRPENVEIQSVASSSSEPTVYGSGIT